jgi:lupus La protein
MSVETETKPADAVPATTTPEVKEVKPSTEETPAPVAKAATPELEDKIIRQVEYYFGDINLNRDKFLQEEIQKDAGWVTVDTLTRFNRLKQLSDDPTVILKALAKSTNELLEIDNEGKRVKRAKALPADNEDFEASLQKNTVYVKGFPEELSLDELYAFFEKHGTIQQIFMRRFPANKKFKGSVFVTFATPEQSTKFLTSESLKYTEDSKEPLVLESQEAYLVRKGPELAKYKDAKKRKEEAKEMKIKQKEEAEAAYLKEQQVLGAVLHLKGMNDEASRETLKELFDEFAKVKYIDFSRGQTEGYVRFTEAGDAQKALDAYLAKKKSEAKEEDKDKEVVVEMKGAKLESRVIAGDEEQEYWVALVKRLTEARSNNKNKRRGNNGGGDRNRNGDNKFRRERNGRDNKDKDGNENKDKKRGHDESENGKPAEKSAEKAPATNGESEAKKVKAE